MDHHAIEYYAKLRNAGYCLSLRERTELKEKAIHREKTGLREKSIFREETYFTERTYPSEKSYWRETTCIDAENWRPFQAVEPLSKEEIDELRKRRKRGEKTKSKPTKPRSKSEGQISLPPLMELPSVEEEEIDDIEKFLVDNRGSMIFVITELGAQDEDGRPIVQRGLANHFDIHQNGRLLDLVPYCIPERTEEAGVDVAIQCQIVEDLELLLRGRSAMDRRGNIRSAAAVREMIGEDESDIPDCSSDEEPECSFQEEEAEETDYSNPWMAQEEEQVASIAPVLLTDCFDIYIDQVRFALDNFRLIKVMAKVGFSDTKEADFTAYPEVHSEARCPRFANSRMVINSKNKLIAKEASLVIRVFTLDSNTDNLSFVGVSAKRLFCESSPGKVRLDAGGFQLRLYQSGMDKNLPPSEDSFPEQDVIPGITILIRCEPHAENPIPMPKYSDGVYRSGRAKPTESECNIIKHYEKHPTYPKTIRHSAILQFQQDRLIARPCNRPREELVEIDEESSDHEVHTWIVERLDRNHWANESHIGFVQLDRIIHYDADFGVNVKIEGVLNVDARNMFVNVVCTILNTTKRDSMATYMTRRHDFMQPINSQNFAQDPPVHITVPLTKGCKAVFYVIGLDAAYEPEPDLAGPGKVKPRPEHRNQKEVKLTQDSLLGWAVVDLMAQEDGYTNNGIHYLPIITGSPPANSRAFRNTPVREWLSQRKAAKEITFTETYGLLRIHIFDAFFTHQDDSPYWLEHGEGLEDFGPIIKHNFENSFMPLEGVPLCKKVLDSLPEKLRDQGTEGEDYAKAEALYEQAMNECFFNLVRGQFSPSDIIQL